MNRSESIKELATALAKAQGKIEPASKDRTNDHFRSAYTTLTSVYEACKGPLSENGLSIAQAIIESDTHDNWSLETMLMHSSGEWISSITPLLVGKKDMQGLGSAITYAKRYALAAMVGVTSDEDDDGNAATGKAPPNRGQERPQNPPQQAGRPAALPVSGQRNSATKPASPPAQTSAPVKPRPAPVAPTGISAPPATVAADAKAANADRPPVGPSARPGAKERAVLEAEMAKHKWTWANIEAYNTAVYGKKLVSDLSMGAFRELCAVVGGGTAQYALTELERASAGAAGLLQQGG